MPLSGAESVKAHCLPFSQIPHTTSLFSDFLSYDPKVQAFYPRSPLFGEWVREESGKILFDDGRRQRVCEILERQNRSWNASEKTHSRNDSGARESRKRAAFAHRRTRSFPTPPGPTLQTAGSVGKKPEL